MWKLLMVSDDIIKAIEELKFEEPTEIQNEVLPLAIRDYADILGSAPTGSGKTLAFGIPLLMRAQEAKLKFTAMKTSESVACEDESSDVIKKETKTGHTKTFFCLTDHVEVKNISDEIERKRRAVFDKLCLIEELDPDTMDVVHVHKIDRLQDENNTVNIAQLRSTAALSGDHGVFGLVLLPTRELALQVADHLRALAKFMQPAIAIQTLVGGISIQKQTRLLERRPEIIVATPGRLWEFLEQEHPYVSTIDKVDVLVVDEADRLVEPNHFTELRSILNFLRFGAGRKNDLPPPEAVSTGRKNKCKSKRESTAQPDLSANPMKSPRQTFVFSATLTFVHKNALVPGSRGNLNKRRKHEAEKMDTASKLGFLRDLLGLSARTKVVDLSTKTKDGSLMPTTSVVNVHKQVDAQMACLVPSGLSEYRLACPMQSDKDIYLLWFLMIGRQKSGLDSLGRCLVFLNSKSGVRRLAGVLRQSSNMNAISSAVNVLHADMVQKQRLRSVERFQACPSGVILATDVAARGLDFTGKSSDGTGVSWVVHFDVPRTAEVYIHRSGRTARAHRIGVSVLLLEPADNVRWQKVMQSLGRPIGEQLQDFNPAPSSDALSDCRKIMRLMRDLDQSEHAAAKKAAERDWFKRSAAEADILLDSDLDARSSDSGYTAPLKKRCKKNKSLSAMHRNLSELLDDFKAKYTKMALSRHFNEGKRFCSFSGVE